MSKRFIHQHVKQAFNHLNTSSDKPLSSTPISSSAITVTNPSSMVQEMVRIQREKALQEQQLVRQHQEELEKRQQAKLLQEQQLIKQQEELAALKIKLEQEKSILLQEQQLKQQQEELLYSVQLEKEKERTLQGETNLKNEQEKFEQQREEMILQSQGLQNQINLLREAPIPIMVPLPDTYMFLTEDTPENEQPAPIRQPTPPPEPTGIDPEYVEITMETNSEENTGIEVPIEGEIENNTESEYDFL